jgi:hypothetical protein
VVTMGNRWWLTHRKHINIGRILIHGIPTRMLFKSYFIK